MKKIIALLMVFAIALCAVGCGKKDGKKKTEAKLELLPEIEHETGYMGEKNVAYIPYEDGIYTTEYDDEADALRKEILAHPDSKVPYDNVYYISYKGDDANDGKSPTTPWKTYKNVITVPQNSAILFERGGVYRGELKIKDNTFVGAFGKGANPCLYGSARNYADASIWTNHGGNVWKTPMANNVGHITFDHGKYNGVMMMNIKALNSDYYYTSGNGYLYLYYSKGNPGSAFESIEITELSVSACITKAGSTGLKNVVVENLCLKYGNFGMTTGGGAENVTMRNLEIGYIGGCTTGEVRWGNGIEIWGNAKKITIENCWVYQCYDAGITNQCSTDPNPANYSYFEDIKFDKNLIEFCQYPIEFFNGDNKGSYCKNMYFTNNILRFAGYQVFDPKMRYGSDSSATACMTLQRNPHNYTNFIITGNIMDTSYGYMVRGNTFNKTGYPTVYGNYYLQQPQLPTYSFEKDVINMTASIINNVPVNSQAEMEAGIKVLDSDPKSVKYVK